MANIRQGKLVENLSVFIISQFLIKNYIVWVELQQFNSFFFLKFDATVTLINACCHPALRCLCKWDVTCAKAVCKVGPEIFYNPIKY